MRGDPDLRLGPPGRHPERVRELVVTEQLDRGAVHPGGLHAVPGRADAQVQVGAGGIDSGPAALGKIRAGADLLQFYSALVYRGIVLVGEIKAALSGALDRGEANKLSDLVGMDAATVTAEPWPV